MSEPADEQVMDDLLSAMDEMEPRDETTTPEPEPAPEPEPEEEEEEVVEVAAEEEAPEDAGEEDTEEEPEEEAADEEDEAGSGDSETEPVSFSTNDPAILAYLARYDNDPAKALKAAVELQRVLTRQGTEKNQALARVRELEGELEQARLLDSTPAWLTEEQREYVQNAIESERPQDWVQQAVKVGEFDIARAIVDQWAEQSPYAAMRVSQVIDQAEARAYQQSQADPGFDRNTLIQQLGEAVPDMKNYEPQMVLAVKNLGEDHPLVLAAKNGNEQETVAALISIYEIAKASSSSVATTRKKVTQQAKDKAVAARQAAAVTSGVASPSVGETPRKVMVAPGLSLEDLDAQFEQFSQ